MRLAFVTSEYPSEDSLRGGLAAYLGRLCPFLAAKGNDVHVFTRSIDGGDIVEEGVHIHRIVPWWSSSHILDRLDPLVPRAAYLAYQDMKAAWALGRAVRRVHRQKPFDTIQLSNVMASSLFVSRSLPTVMRLSSFKPDCVAANGGARNLNERIRLLLERRSICRQNYLFAPSFLVANRVKEMYSREVSVIETPFSPEPTLEDSSALDLVNVARPYALFFGRLSRLKGLIALAEALPAIWRKVPEFRLVLIGSDSNTAPNDGSVVDFLRARADGAKDRLIFVPSLAHHRLYPVIQNARTVILPSLADNLPNAAIESMWFERVVIGSRIASFDQLIQDGVSGLLVEPVPDQISESVVRAWNLSEDERQQIGTNAKQRIERMTPELLVPELLRYYQSVAEARATGASVCQVSTGA